MALVVAPEESVEEWFAALDDQMARSPAFFADRPVVVDLSNLPGHSASHPKLIHQLEERDMRIIGVEGADEGWADADLWGRVPLLSATKTDKLLEVAENAPPPPPVFEPSSLLVDRSVRSGQSVVHEKGDLIIMGSVASGAEVIAGGSVHVYGALRGRAVGGLLGQAGARIFCTRMQAELMAIDGVYKTADDMEPGLRGRPVQAWLDGDVLQMAALD